MLTALARGLLRHLQAHKFSTGIRMQAQYAAAAAGRQEFIDTDPSPSPAVADARRIQTISWKPRAMVYHNFLSDSEARHIIGLAEHQVGV